MTEPDPRFSLANERTYLAWIRTGIALLAAGVVVAKAVSFHHDVLRWMLAVPPVVAGIAIAWLAHDRLDRYDAALRAQAPLPRGRAPRLLALGLTAYGLVVLVALLLDG